LESSGVCVSPTGVGAVDCSVVKETGSVITYNPSTALRISRAISRTTNGDGVGVELRELGAVDVFVDGPASDGKRKANIDAPSRASASGLNPGWSDS
jgi:hypothetical protein